MSTVGERLQGKVADRYTVRRELGRGGMATVYLAHDLKHDRAVALKVLHPDLAATLGAERFLREIRLAARLRHPHILPLHDSGEAGGLLYYVMPYVAGETLRQRLKHESRLPTGEAVRLAREVADALDYAHRQGVVHRDVKPENILLEENHAVVSDFGIARAISSAGGDALTETGLVIGTAAYMSPEQAMGEPDLDGRSDVYSLGCVLYEMLAGRPAFAGRNTMAIITRHFTEPAPRIRAVRGDVAEELDAAVTRALAKEPEGRFATAAEFAAALTLRPGAPPSANSIVVLDFANVSEDAALDWLSSGIAETVSADLQSVGSLTVIARDKVRRALAARGTGAGGDAGMLDLGRALGARWVVWGGFQRVGDRIRIIPRFADTGSEEAATAAKIDGPMEEIFALQDRIVITLMDALDVRLSAAQLARIHRVDTRNLTAYECLAKGRLLFNQFGKTSFAQAAEYLQRAIDIDPGYGAAYSALGSIYVFRYIGRAEPDDLEKGMALLRRAVELDPNLAEAHHWLAYAYLREHRFDDAERSAARATELDPNSTYAHYFRGAVAHIYGVMRHRWELYHQAAAELTRAIELEPGHQAAHMLLAETYRANGQYAAARGLVDAALRIEEHGTYLAMKFLGALTQRAALHIRDGELDDAAALVGRALERYPTSDHVYAELFTTAAHVYAGEIAHRRGEFDVAVEQYSRACERAGRHPAKLGIGYYLIQARLGLARAFRVLKLHRDEEREFAAASELIAGRDQPVFRGFAFGWVWGGSDVEVFYDLARYYALAGRSDDAVEALRTAADAGWGELAQLDADTSFARLRHDPEVEEIRRLVEGRGPIPEYPASLLTRPQSW